MDHDLEYAEKALKAAESAVRYSKHDDPDLPARQSELPRLLRSQFKRRPKEHLLKNAKENANVAYETENAGGQTPRLSNLVDVLFTEFNDTEKEKPLDTLGRAIGCAFDANEKTLGNSRHKAARLGGLSSLYEAKFRYFGCRRSLEQTIEYGAEDVKIDKDNATGNSGDQIPQTPARLGSLSNLYEACLTIRRSKFILKTPLFLQIKH
ncbi:hypothetical protein J3458_000396 [Metarhizium acridum]|uniref:uncharacterized protein n=1 Tax=Metarhizium acridum TaxID=92637 RepID=UPI001C6BB2A0|nr:hypothetical protein J3458_000396 [Metarhizium acridum]